MQPFVVGHATHPDGRMALALAAAQVDARLAARRPAPQPTLGLLYLTDALAPQVDELLAELQQRWPGVHWAGTVGVGVLASSGDTAVEVHMSRLRAKIDRGFAWPMLRTVKGQGYTLCSRPDEAAYPHALPDFAPLFGAS